MPPTRRPLLLATAPALLALAGAPGCDAPKASAPATPKIEARKAHGDAMTREVLPLERALAEGGVPADMTVGVSDPLSQVADANRTLRGQSGVMAVDRALQFRQFQGINDPPPLDYDGFMAEIIKKDQPDGISLPQLPYYQEYAWDAASQKLVVVEFPQKKADFEKQKP